MGTTYRAAVWTSFDGQAEVRLTGPEQAHLPDDELIAEAKAELRREGGTMDGGRIIITEWRTYAVCPCGERFHAPFGDKFHVHHVVCPSCGRHKKEWSVRASRYVSQSVWWQPWTWGRGYWENREEG